MYTRILFVSATLVALTVPPAQAGGFFHHLFSGCSFSTVQTQCAKNLTHGNKNWAKIEQDQWGPGYQFGFQIQDGNGNKAYTGQKGTDEFALTVQKGDNNTAGTHQDGSELAAVTIQKGDGMWSSTSMVGDGGLVTSYQSN